MAPLHRSVLGTGPIGQFTQLLSIVADTTSLETPVPTCGDWTLADLTWHLAEVQHFWTYIIEHRPSDYTDYVQPPRPADEALADELTLRMGQLLGALSAADPMDTAWSWAAEQTVDFTIRRQSHEALIHAIDGVLAAGQSMPSVDPLLAADGVDEMVRVMMHDDSPEPFVAGGVVELHASDTGDTWMVEFGRCGDNDAAHVLDTGDAEARFAGSALHLDLWLWGRPTDKAIEATGDPRTIDNFRRFTSTNPIE